MRSATLSVPALATAAAVLAPAAAAQNPWGIDLGSYRSVAVVWKGAGNIEMDGRVLGSGSASGEGLFTPTAMRMSMTISATMQGTTTGGTVWSASSAETESSDNGGDTVTVEPSFRALLAREFDALGAAAREKVLANVRILGEVAADELDAAPYATGEKTGSATIAGQRCDVFTTGEASYCLLSGAPAVMLRFAAAEGGYETSATEVRFNVAVPASAWAPPAGKVVVRRTAAEAMEDRRWAADLYAERNDGNEPPSLAALAKFVMRYLSTEDLEEEPEEEPGAR
jgi:hypothetical protein